MNRLHKKIHISLKQKFYFVFLFFIAYGWYKNGLLPYLNHFYPFSHLILILLYPGSGFLIGALFDYLFKNKYPYNNKFYGLLFSLFIPISTSIFIFLLVLTFLLFLNTFFVSKKDWDFHFLVFGKLLLVFLLFRMQQYNYANLLEDSHLFVYSYLDGIFGNHVNGLFTSNTLFLLVSFLFLYFDEYYKKEIPLYSYGIYLLTLLFYAILKREMAFLLENMLSSSILFALIFLATLSPFSPYSKKRIFFYSCLIGISILPFSLMTNFYEGVYFSLILANLCLIVLNHIQIRIIRSKI